MKLGNDKLHLCLEVGGKRFSYTYIRKNACSSWKKFFVSESPFSKHAKDFSNPINFMAKYHRVNSLKELKEIDDRIVVLRDPVERLYSGFINQYVMRLNKDRQGVMHEEVSLFLGKKPEEITFEVFLKDYVLKSKDKLNVHFAHQTEHLTDVEYNEKWKLENLYKNSESFFGVDIADRYFKKKRNSTQRIEKVEGDFKSMRLDKVFEIYSADNKLPSMSSLIGDEERFLLREFYKKDYELIGAL